MDDNIQWIEQQFRALYLAGVNGIDAITHLRWAMLHLPPGADPATWTPTPDELQTPLDASDLADARAAWMENGPEWAKRLLEAVEEVTQ